MPSALLSRHTADQLVAFGAGGPRSARELLTDAGKVFAALPAPRSAADQLLFVVRQDRYLVAVALLAALARGQRVALSSELGRDVITELARYPETVGVLHDTASGIPFNVEALLRVTASAPALTRAQLNAGVLRLRSYARDADGRLRPEDLAGGVAEGAGGTGAAPERSLWDELSPLAARLAPEGARFASTLSPEQPFDVGATVLLPLLSGGAFLRETLPVDAALSARLAREAVAVLVSVPRHLRALARQERVPGTRLAQLVSGVQALPTTLSGELARRHGVEVIDGAPQGPAARATAEAAVETASGALSCELIEEHCLTVPGVTDAAALLLSAAGSERARLLIAFSGSAGMQAVTSALTGRFALKLAPEDVLRLTRLARSSTGRVDRIALLRLFRLRPDGSPVSFQLRWGEERVSRVEARETRARKVHVPEGYGYFDGHFPGYPILPGAAQLSELVLPYLRKVRPELGELAQMSRLKFTGRIQPAETLEVLLHLRDGSASVDFELRRGDSLCAAGTLSFAAAVESGS